MQVRAFIGFILLTLALGCREDQQRSTVSAPVEQPSSAALVPSTKVPEPAGLPPAPTKPQPKLATMKLWLGTNEITAELARSEVEIRTGMMWRTNMAEMEGMLFIFPVPHQVAFWMRNTLLPLSCAYINPDGTILEIYDMKPLDLTSIPAQSSDIQFVLEMNQGWFQRNNVSTGTVVRTPHGSLRETFFRR